MSWRFHNIESDDGVHVHHMVIGVVLIMVAFGLVGAKPHLPSFPPLAAHSAQAPVAASEPAAAEADRPA